MDKWALNTSSNLVYLRKKWCGICDKFTAQICPHVQTASKRSKCATGEKFIFDQKIHVPIFITNPVFSLKSHLLTHSKQEAACC
jgi:hypothetical protein